MINRQMNLKEKILDLIKQSTEDRSHYYTGSVLRESYDHIEDLEIIIKDLRSYLRAVLPKSYPCYKCSTEDHNPKIDHSAYCSAEHCLSYTCNYGYNPEIYKDE